MENLVTIETYTNVVEAEIAANLLASNKIKTFLKDREIVAQNPFYANAVGGIKLQVPINTADKAIEILKQLNKSTESNAKHTFQVKFSNLLIISLVIPFILPLLPVLLVLKPSWYPGRLTRAYIILFGGLSWFFILMYVFISQ